MKRLRTYIPVSINEQEIAALILWHLDQKGMCEAQRNIDGATWHDERRQYWGDLHFRHRSRV